jgi:CheY-like chemotaxis protein
VNTVSTSTTARSAACVLVVDDEDDTRETLREAIEMIGCTAMLAANGAEAMQVLAACRPCLIILDLMMPVMTGEQVLDNLRQQPALAGLPVVISTSIPSRAPAGIPVLAKPIDLARLWEQIRRNCSCA